MKLIHYKARAKRKAIRSHLAMLSQSFVKADRVK